MTNPKKEKVKKEEVILTPTQVLDGMLDANKEDHYNYEDKSIGDFKISSGSLGLDREIGGGFGSGIHRFIGVREGGKTSCCLKVCKNFLDKFGPNGFVVYFKAEGRLDPELFTKSGISKDDPRFRVIVSNIYEFVIDTMRTLTHNNPTFTHYLFVIDSVDGLITRDEMAKTSAETAMVGSSARMLSIMLKKIATSFSAKGHMGLFISQERSAIVINPYAAKDQKQGNSSGGNAIQHYANFVLNFKSQSREDLIFENDDKNGKTLGHYCKVVLLKTTNDNTGVLVRYPIKRKVGIWTELEVADACLEFEIFKPEKTTFKFTTDSSEISKKLKEKFGDRIPEGLVGKKKYEGFFTDPENKDIVDFLYEYFKKTIIG
jgi:RecA/RadA recombinase